MNKMRKKIGNITVYRSEQVEKDPTREKMRLELQNKLKEARIFREADKSAQTMSGKRDISEDIKFYFDNKGCPPEKFNIDTIKKQYKAMYSQYRWLGALTKEVNRKLRELNPEDFEKEQQKKEAAAAEAVQTRKTAYIKYLEENKEHMPQVAYDLMLESVQRKFFSNKMRAELARDPMNTNILGLKEIEKMLCHLFSNNITNNNYKIETTDEEKYMILKEERDVLEVKSAEIELKLYFLRELIDSIDEYFRKTA